MNDKRTENAAKYLSMMSRGEIPPHNWTERVAKGDKRKIYNAYFKWCVEELNRGGNPRILSKGMTEKQRLKLYEVRGYASDEIERKRRHDDIVAAENAKEEQHLKWLACHGGQHTQDVMVAASRARKERGEYRRCKRYLKTWRKANRLGFCCVKKAFWHLPNGTISYKYLGSIPSSWYSWCDERRRLSERRTPPSLEEMRPSIVEEATACQYRIDMLKTVARVYGEDEWIVRLIRKAGLFDLEDYIVEGLPFPYSNSKLFKHMRDELVGKDMLHFLAYWSVRAEDLIQDELSRRIRREYQTANESQRQLRALGFVA